MTIVTKLKSFDEIITAFCILCHFGWCGYLIRCNHTVRYAESFQQIFVLIIWLNKMGIISRSLFVIHLADGDKEGRQSSGRENTVRSIEIYEW